MKEKVRGLLHTWNSCGCLKVVFCVVGIEMYREREDALVWSARFNEII